MPFDTAGESPMAYMLGGDDDGGGRKKRAGCCCCLSLLLGIALVSAGCATLRSASDGLRESNLKLFRDDLIGWIDVGSAVFAGLRWQISVAGENAHEMRGERFPLPLSSFGEPKPLFNTPNTPITDYRYADYIRCPSGINKTCKLQLTSADNQTTIERTVVARTQVGPTTHMLISEPACQWYDSDLPMAAVGFGGCNDNAKMQGGENYNYGPDRCVLDHYLDADGCPADVYSAPQLVQV